jgi:hypothetical protein
MQVISADSRGFIKYWSSDSYRFPADTVRFKSIFSTNLMDCVSEGAVPRSITVSHWGARFAITCTDMTVRAFDFLSGHCLQKWPVDMKVRQHNQVISHHSVAFFTTIPLFVILFISWPQTSSLDTKSFRYCSGCCMSFTVSLMCPCADGKWSL